MAENIPAKKADPGRVQLPSSRPMDLLSRMAFDMGVNRDQFWSTIMLTVMPEGATQEQALAFLAVADSYGLNPFLGQITAFAAKGGGIKPMVPIDGWATIINRHEQCDGWEIDFSDEITTPNGGKPCPVSATITIYRRDRSHPVRITEFLDELYQPPKPSRNGGGMFDGPWQTHTKRMLRHKVLIQGARVGLGITGIYDPDEAERFRDAQFEEVHAATGSAFEQQTATTADTIKKSLNAAKASVSSEPAPPDEVPSDAEAGAPDDWSLLEGDDLKMAAGRLATTKALMAAWSKACKSGDDEYIRTWARKTDADRKAASPSSQAAPSEIPFDGPPIDSADR